MLEKGMRIAWSPTGRKSLDWVTYSTFYGAKNDQGLREPWFFKGLAGTNLAGVPVSTLERLSVPKASCT